MVFRIEVNLGNGFLLLKTMKRKFDHIQSVNKFNINIPKHIRHCQKYCTYCSPERYTILIHNEHLNQIHYTMCPYDELLIMAKSICTNLMPDDNNDHNNQNDTTTTTTTTTTNNNNNNNNNSNNSITILVLSITCGKLSNFTKYNPVLINRNINTSTHNNKNNTTTTTNISSTNHTKSSNPLNTTISINIQTISKTIQRAKLENVNYKQSRTKSKWGIINLSTCNNIHSDILIDLNTSTNSMNDGKKNICYTYDNHYHYYCCYYYYYYYCYHYHYYSYQKSPLFTSLWSENILNSGIKDIQLGSKIPNINCDACTQKINITQNSNEKHTGNMEKIFIENETDIEVMRYMSQFDLIKNYAQIRSENQKPNRLKDLKLSVNLRPPEPVGCQLLQMNSAPVTKGS
ncbi:unnamed protein product [Schistosoma rodhaini]|uniref:Uncharacterized protein n=1 Tax=Schistosoma rodhaini TaxID=6188 RepID=A0AA85F4L3_9TREM|nr:unnamed protein product [Schistosoma rodhaini]